MVVTETERQEVKRPQQRTTGTSRSRTLTPGLSVSQSMACCPRAPQWDRPEVQNVGPRAPFCIMPGPSLADVGRPGDLGELAAQGCPLLSVPWPGYTCPTGPALSAAVRMGVGHPPGLVPGETSSFEVQKGPACRKAAGSPLHTAPPSVQLSLRPVNLALLNSGPFSTNSCNLHTCCSENTGTNA
ncbi:hypothetical protein TREES_T100015636 [Tupaia chinensis]|uniref:Uncharacterized protein n=1 Tax=Tupaia chinensis TaxID=246437 RepID=L9L7S3_TUPCH|nr:hypothetical protein TREES_T100015636 [Tupaia chinensis]